MKKLPWLALIVFLGFVLRLAYVLLVPTLPVSDYWNYNTLAINMLQQGVFGFGTTPITHLSPGTSFFIGLFYAITGSFDLIYPKLAQVALGVIDIVLVYYIALKIFNEKTALIAASIWSLFPTPIEYTSVLASENPFTFLSLLSIALLLALNPKSKLYYAGVFLVGAIMGISILVRPAALLLPVLFLAYLLYPMLTKKPDLKRIAMVMVILAIGVLLAAGPWCMRNYVEFGHFATSSNDGVNLWMGNNQYATGTYMDMSSLVNQTFGDVSGLTDFQKDALYSKAGRDYMMAHPLGNSQDRRL